VGKKEWGDCSSSVASKGKIYGGQGSLSQKAQGALGTLRGKTELGKSENGKRGTGGKGRKRKGKPPGKST